MAFFPCIHFCGISQTWFSITHRDYQKWDDKQKIDYILNKSNERTRLFNILNKFVGVCLIRKIRMVFENPYAMQTYLKTFLKPPDIIDSNRMLRGDYMIKPTGYWFWNCEPTHGFTYQKDKTRREPLKMKQGSRAGLCSEERSMISPDYARNFICDFILGKVQPNSQLTLF